MIALKLGQPVMVTEGTGRSKSAQHGTVTKIGRVWCEVTPEGRLLPIRMRMDTQNQATGYAYEARFYTLEQWADRERMADATKYLYDQGIYTNLGSPWRGRVVELAEIIRKAATS